LSFYAPIQKQLETNFRRMKGDAIMKKTNKILWVTVLLLAVGTVAGAETESGTFPGEELLPPDAKPGECYTRIFIPPTYKTMNKAVIKHEASERVEIVPAQYEWVEEKVLVTAPSERLEVVPAEYEWVEEEVLVREESTRIEEIPAIYETVTEKVVDRPAQTLWKKGGGLMQKVDDSTGEIMCLVEVPETYKTVRKRVLVQPASTREIKIPAQYKIVRKKVMTKPPAVKKVLIPGEHKMVKVKKVVSPPRVKRVLIPAEYQTVTERVKTTEGKMEWHRVLCETNMTVDVVASIQRAVKKAGYDPGRVDGDFGEKTLLAIQAYQRDKGLAVGNLTYETLRSLGVKFSGSSS
jgi:hypothetical protein